MPRIVDRRPAAVPGDFLPARVDGHEGLLPAGEGVVDSERRERSARRGRGQGPDGLLTAGCTGRHPGDEEAAGYSGTGWTAAGGGSERLRQAGQGAGEDAGGEGEDVQKHGGGESGQEKAGEGRN